MSDTLAKLKELKCAVIIPTYNNAGTLARVIEDVSAFCEDILVVNDGSTDDTERILQGIPYIQVLSYPQNKGKGYALKKALARTYERGFRYAITIDADGQHFADDLPAFAAEIEKHPDSLLIGQRNIEAENMPGKNTFANKFSNFWFRVETGKKMSDTQSGYRLYPLHKIQGIRLLTLRYEFELEIIVRAAWLGVNVSNIPVKVYYPPQEERVSHFRPLRDFTRISLLNTVLVTIALLYYYPLCFLKQLRWKNIVSWVNKHITRSGESDATIASSIGWGVFWGIMPVWGYQMLIAFTSAHFLKLNKGIALLSSNISLPPLIPVIIYGSLATGGWMLGTPVVLRLSEATLDSAAAYLMQYLIGSVVLAVAAGLTVGLVSYLMLTLKKRVAN